MVGLPYVGASQSNARDLVNYGYVSSLFNLNLSQVAVDALISTTLASYVTKAYVDGQDALNATKAFIDAGDATRLKLAQIGAANGAVGLNVAGRIDGSRVSAGSTQRWPHPFISPSAYNTSNVVSSGAETIVYPVAVADPGYTYKLLVTGILDSYTSVDGESAVVQVRQGSTTGQVVAGGYGMNERYLAGVSTAFTTSGSTVYSIPTWAGALDVVAIGSGSTGQDGFIAFAVPFVGRGGGAASWNSVTLTRGSNLPVGTTSLTVNVAAGPASGTRHDGASTTVTGTGVTTLTAGGGNCPAFGATGSLNGLGPGNTTFDGQTYVGGAVQGTAGITGNSPGGGGAGGSIGGGNGGAGGTGAVYILAYPTPSIPSGPVSIVPTPMNAQTALTGATTLYVTVTRSGSSSTQTISTIVPKLMVIPVPA